jgi:hypothetical protein
VTAPSRNSQIRQMQGRPRRCVSPVAVIPPGGPIDVAAQASRRETLPAGALSILALNPQNASTRTHSCRAAVGSWHGSARLEHGRVAAILRRPRGSYCRSAAGNSTRRAAVDSHPNGVSPQRGRMVTTRRMPQYGTTQTGGPGGSSRSWSFLPQRTCGCAAQPSIECSFSVSTRADFRNQRPCALVSAYRPEVPPASLLGGGLS